MRLTSLLLLQVFNKLLSLASTASSQKYQSHMWSQMLLSTHAFLKSISNVSGKDIGPLIKQWVYPVVCAVNQSARVCVRQRVTVRGSAVTSDL